MKKINYIIFAYMSAYIISCCGAGDYEPDTFYIKTHTAKADLSSWSDKVFELSKNEICLTISGDSIDRRITANPFSIIPKAYACSLPNDANNYENYIDSINVYTVYDFDSVHTAGSNINDLIGRYRYHADGPFFEPIILENEKIGLSQSFGFISKPANDSVQLIIKGRITEINKTFEINTNTFIKN